MAMDMKEELSRRRRDAEIAELLFDIFDLQYKLFLLRINLFYGRIKKRFQTTTPRSLRLRVSARALLYLPHLREISFSTNSRSL